MSLIKHNLTTAPAEEPVTLAETKSFLGIDDTESDSTITMLIETARRKIENYIGGGIVDQSWTLVLDYFPTDIELLKMPVQSVTAIRYYDTDGVSRTLDSSNYYLDNAGANSRAWVVLASSTDWPDIQDRINAVHVEYVTGFGAAADVPADIKTTLLQLVRLYLQLANPLEGYVVPTKAINWILADNLGDRRMVLL